MRFDLSILVVDR